jgi:diguanylate cyclase (GGDEF)-like protein
MTQDWLTDGLRHLARAHRDELNVQRGLGRLQEGMVRLREDPREAQRIEDIIDLVEADRITDQDGPLEGLPAHAYEPTRDPLTGIPDRASFVERGAQAIDRQGAETSVGVLLLDVVGLAEVNAARGRDAGDDLLRSMATRLVRLKHADEFLARLGGGEFALLLTLPRDLVLAEAATRERAAALLSAVAAPVPHAAGFLPAAARAGFAVIGRGGCSSAELLRRAASALSQAMRTGQWVVRYDATHDTASPERITLITEMHRAVEDGGQLVVSLQPTVHLATGAPLGAEALVRWLHPRRGRLLPGEFIPYIEQTDLIGLLTDEVLDRALAACASWVDDGLELPVSVNLSPRCLLDRGLPQRVERLLTRHGVPPHRLVLEITETVALSEQTIVEDVLGALRDMGIQLSLDDFGTGYSSLTALARVKVDEIKIDQSFVATMGSSRRSAAIVATMVKLARSLGLRVIGEGVETPEQRETLAELGCTGAQGFHLFPPMASAEARAALRSGTPAGAAVISLGRRRATWRTAG